MTGVPQLGQDSDEMVPLGIHCRAELMLGTVGVVNRPVDAAETVAANRRWWDADAESYLAEHGDFLGLADFVWCPEGLRESEAGLLGELAGRCVLEVGCGSEHHRTLGDRVREIVAAGLVLEDLVEPEWPAGLRWKWGQWSPLRGALFPGTAIFCCRREDTVSQGAAR